MKKPSSATDTAILSDLLAGDTPSTPEPATPIPVMPSKPKQRETIQLALNGLYEKLARSIALLFVLFIAAALWRADGFFTLLALENMGVKLAGAGGWRWLIPVAITATTIGLWPRAGASRFQISFFVAVNTFNLGTSFAGLISWGAGRQLPLFTGYTIPSVGWPLWILAGLAALILAFGPEKFGRWAGADLMALWK